MTSENKLLQGCGTHAPRSSCHPIRCFPGLQEPCTPGDKKHSCACRSRWRTPYKNNGCGIAAPQVGVTKRLVVIDVDYDGEGGERNPIVLVNPQIMELRGEPERAGEGCLSCPGVTVPIERPALGARPSYYDLDGELWEIEGDGLLALPAARDRPLERQDALRELRSGDPHRGASRAYEEARAAGARPGDTSVEVG